MKTLFRFLSVALITVTMTACMPVSNTSEASNAGARFTPVSSSLRHDWGKINIRGGDVEQTFRLKNDQDKDLYLLGAVTSCMCTASVFEMADGTTSDTYGMHGNTDWDRVVQPGEEFDVRVVFDPMAHGPNATGPIRRTVNVIGKFDLDVEGIAYTRIDVIADVLSEEDFNAL